jgi:hypothetical protein
MRFIAEYYVKETKTIATLAIEALDKEEATALAMLHSTPSIEFINVEQVASL